ncbi:hypothetical protein [uncultured phage cr49_1]|jgi:hypothetical protein|uniref:Uncharacterized protein n=1 Tax=uncultured phage cr49_1 TaxID=2986402 RepID=A0AAE7V1N9_9CAUD|nr:hypothetical protein M1M42_gp68 [uncultured phage cr49_1]QWM89019.1 hypothetical protein [uncultured phage cr49_1]DAG88191.1 MAG TPA: protein of unknown function DUF1660 [Crassvirales sp.]
MNWDCFIHGHKYKIMERHDLLDDRNSIIGKVIVSRCELCGRITVKTIYTVNNYVRRKY